jgi:hypothetical protein
LARLLVHLTQYRRQRRHRELNLADAKPDLPREHLGDATKLAVGSLKGCATLDCSSSDTNVLDRSFQSSAARCPGGSRPGRMALLVPAKL